MTGECCRGPIEAIRAKVGGCWRGPVESVSKCYCGQATATRAKMERWCRGLLGTTRAKTCCHGPTAIIRAMTGEGTTRAKTCCRGPTAIIRAMTGESLSWSNRSNSSEGGRMLAWSSRIGEQVLLWSGDGNSSEDGTMVSWSTRDNSSEDRLSWSNRHNSSDDGRMLSWSNRSSSSDDGKILSWSNRSNSSGKGETLSWSNRTSSSDEGVFAWSTRHNSTAAEEKVAWSSKSNFTGDDKVLLRSGNGTVSGNGEMLSWSKSNLSDDHVELSLSSDSSAHDEKSLSVDEVMSALKQVQTWLQTTTDDVGSSDQRKDIEKMLERLITKKSTSRQELEMLRSGEQSRDRLHRNQLLSVMQFDSAADDKLSFDEELLSRLRKWKALVLSKRLHRR
eukprot:TRINITY_DN143_c2_g1_i1.p1 TRINITY_DN143_c2_g1~~TRINITY_DN143_c2_g1_i1.p1  ORF type:complete len:399 (-),score=31.80 TRINITY_DN143_c2_g1_i1:158-1330(-)